MTTALDDFMEKAGIALANPSFPPAQAPALKATQKKELDLWHTWNKEGRKAEHLVPIFESYKPLIKKQVNVFANKVEIPTSAIEAEFQKHFVDAVKTFNPAKGAQLNTWVQNRLQKASRFVKTYQNVGKIPEQQISKINKFKQAKDELSTKFGFEPDTTSLAGHLGWSHRQVIQLNKELSRRTLPASMFEKMDPAEHLNPKELEALKLLQYDLGPQERTVYEYTFGMNGRPLLKPGQISSATGIHASKISRIRNKLQQKLTEAMEVI